MKVKMNLFSVKSIKEAQAEIEAYKKSLSDKCKRIVEELAKEGITVAEQNTGKFGKYILFSTELDPIKDGYKAVLVATDKEPIISTWVTKDGVQQAEVSGLLMAEFGSGFKAQNPKNIPEVGQGTFPDQKHAFDQGGWYYQSVDGVWHHTTGIAPTQPMLKASLHMTEIVKEVVERVFANG